MIVKSCYTLSDGGSFVFDTNLGRFIIPCARALEAHELKAHTLYKYKANIVFELVPLNDQIELLKSLQLHIVQAHLCSQRLREVLEKNAG